MGSVAGGDREHTAGDPRAGRGNKRGEQAGAGRPPRGCRSVPDMYVRPTLGRVRDRFYATIDGFECRNVWQMCSAIAMQAYDLVVDRTSYHWMRGFEGSVCSASYWPYPRKPTVLNGWRADRRRGVRGGGEGACVVCFGSFAGNDAAAVVFACGHVVHTGCVAVYEGHASFFEGR